MRILAATPYHEPEGGGLERYAHATLSRLAARGHEVRVLCFSANKKMAGSETQDGMLVQRVLPRLRLGNTPIGLVYARRCQEMVQDWRPDVVIGHTPVPFAAESAWRAAAVADVPFVVTYHAGLLRGSSTLLTALAVVHQRTIEARMLAAADRLIAVSPFVRDHALARHRHKTTVIAPGVDTRRYFPAARHQSSNNSILLISPLSKSYRWKGLDVMMDAQRIVQKRFPRAQLTVVGDGERRMEVAQRARRDGLNLLLAGRVAEADLVAAYRRAAVVVLPSTSDAESFGLVLAEANACGRPVVASDIGGVSGFVRDGDNGLLARPGDAQDLAAKLCSVLADPARADGMGRRGRRRVLREHRWDDAATATERVLRQATGGED